MGVSLTALPLNDSMCLRGSVLDVSLNRLNGSISPLLNLPKLTILDMSYNNFSNIANVSFANLTSLQRLDLGANSNFGGTMPSSVSTLRKLR